MNWHLACRLRLGYTLFLIAFIAGPGARQSRAQQPFLTAERSTSNAVRLTLSGAADKYHRIDYSTDLNLWSPLDILSNTNATKRLTDSINFADKFHFYRALEVDPVTGIVRLVPEQGAPGTSVTIEGQFFANGQPGDNIVLFGGIEGTVTEATSTHLVVTVPQGARTGPISVNTPNGIIFSDAIFTVICSNSVSFTPPAGFNPAAYVVASDFGAAVTISPGHYGVNIADGMPSLIVASPLDTNNQAFLYAIAGPCGSDVTMNAFSTAQALVFQCPLFLTDDSVVAERLRAIIGSDSSVAAFAQVIAQVYATNTVNPFSTSNFISAYAAAVESVATNEDAISASAQPQNPGGLAHPSAAVFPLEWYQTRFLELSGSGSKYSVKGFPFNPVDWLVRFEEVDVDKAFPNGHFDFDKVVLNNFPPLELYPTKPGFDQERHVSADLAASRLNFVSYLSKELVKAMSSTSSQVDQSVTFPNNDTIYVVRGIGPSFLPPEDYDFVQQNYSDMYVRVVAINIVSAAIDLASAAFDSGKLKTVLGDAKFQVKLIDESIKLVPTVQSKEDFMVAAGKIEAFLLKEAVNDLVKRGAGSLGDAGAAVLEGVFDNKKLKVASGLGQIVERASGIFRTTTLETSLVMVGNPFQLQVLSITPGSAKPGTDLTIMFRGSPNGRPFDANNPQDQVNFEGVTVFDGQVRAVSGPDANGVQTLTVRVPSDLPATSDGTYTVYVNCQGRRGSGSFSLSSRPIITSITPNVGFAPGTLAGTPFIGTLVLVKGANFVSSDKFFFSGGIEATNKFGSTGGVGLFVPDGAQSGPITIQKTYNGQLYQTSSPPFTVLGPPTLISMTPSNGPIGTTVAFQADNLGIDATAVRVQFNGTTAKQPGLIGNVASIAVPSGATSGAVTLFTPAGQVASSFLVTTGLVGGSEIDVGGSSIISIGRSAEIAAGTGAPIDDDADYVLDDHGQIIQSLDPPFEEGDYVYPDRHTDATPRFAAGAVYSDLVLVSGTVGGDATFTGPNDVISGGTLSGTITLAGDNLKLGTINITGQVIVNGDNNTIYYSTFHGCPGDALIIHGNHNQVLGCNFYTNGGDGIRIDGGKYNYVEINDSQGNGGNGITLTNGADFNKVLLTTGRTSGGKGVPDSGNVGHGIALIGQARFNDITTFSPGIFGNKKDGVYLDGTGVFSNRFTAIVSSDNHGNGVTVTNGGRGNMFGTVDFNGTSVVNLTADRNGGSGAAFYGAADFQVAIRCTSNQYCGLLLSGVVETNNFTSAFLSIATGNSHAAARFENGTRGVELRTSSSAKTNGAGLELEGTNVVQNSFTMDITGSTGNGVNVLGARSNTLVLNVGQSVGNGVLVSGGGGNTFRIRSVSGNQGDGFVLTDGATNNRILPDAFVASFTSNRNGFVINNGSSGNVVDRFTGTYSRSNGIVVHGGATTGNRILAPVVQTSGGDGIRFEFGANGNTVGYLPANTVFGSTDGSISDNTGAGIRITDPGTDSNFVFRTYFSSLVRTQAVGVVIENGAAHNTLQFDSFSKNGDGIVIANQAHDTSLKSLYIDSNLQHGIVVSNAAEIFVGSSSTNDYSQITKNQIGVDIIGAQSASNWLGNNFIQQNSNAAVVLEAGAHHNQIGPANDIRSNYIGVLINNAHSNDVTANVMTLQGFDNAQIIGGSLGNQITGNMIDHAARGVFVSDAGSLGNSILYNAITANLFTGIDLASGGNTEIPAPAQMSISDGTLTGTVNAPDGSRIEVFLDPGSQGEQLLAIGEVAGNKFSIPLLVDPQSLGIFDYVNATVTDLNGNTSEFGTTAPPGFPPARVVFTSTRDGNQEIYLRDSGSASASGGVRLTFNPAADHSPVLSCDEQAVLFASDRSGNDDIYSMPAIAGAAATQLTVNTARDYSPHWSINCAQVIFVSERDGSPAIYIMDANGANQTRLSPPGVTDVSPAFSPDGTKVAFASNRSGSYHLYVMNSDGSGAQILGAGSGTDTQPVWSPDGQLIAFVSTRDGNEEIYTMHANGTQVTRITNDGASDVSPTWTPDGKNLIFSSNRGSAGYELYAVDKNGGAAHRLSVSNGDNTEPSAR